MQFVRTVRAVILVKLLLDNYKEKRVFRELEQMCLYIPGCINADFVNSLPV